ncbi:TonB-dependent receptor [Pelagerythrobacter marensis]|uniref:TonB-dependent receptor n=1 Tax=Pelagerythrobacter marensis TaxID=543877 RepID=A0A0G3XC85_9SPHN|nr:TonB-dependent receptor [Pelagerythrobacter marensis]AKM08199.1 TonB-dependent receptor [Pelagerythrobacter marensis]
MHSGILRNRSTFLAAASVLALGAGSAPAFAQAQDATDTGQAVSEEAGENVIVVTGFRASLESALNAKRESNLIIESVTAEDIGKFPDQNVAESLQRLPGIQIDRENGQGSKVRIRGLEQNVTLLNGELFVSGLEVYKVGEGNYNRYDSLEGVPSELIGGIEVFKSPNASLLEGGLGGIVNLKTRNPLDLKSGLTLAGNAKMSKGSEIAGWEPAGAAVIGYNFNDRLGVIASFSYEKTNNHVNVLGGDNRGNWAFDEGRRDTATVPTNYYAPEYRYVTDRDQYRRRWGASLGITYRPTDTLEVSAQYFHSDMKIDTREASVKFPFGQGESQGLVGDYSINENGVLTQGTVRAQSAEAISFVDVSNIKADNVQFALEWDNDTNFRASVMANYASSSMKREVANNDVRYTAYGVRGPGTSGPQPGFTPNADAPPTFDFTYTNGDFPSFGIAPGSPQDLFSNPDYGFFKSHWAFGDRSDIDGHSIRGDFAYDVADGFEDTITLSAGFRYGQRTVDFVSGRYLADYSGKGELDATAIPEDERVDGYSYNWTPYGYFQDGAIGYKICDLPEPNKPAAFAGCTRFGNSPALITPYQTLVSNPERMEAIRNFAGGGRIQGDTVLVADRSQMTNALEWIQALYPDTSFTFFEDPLQSYRVKEETKSGYLMADLGGPDDSYHVNVGLRVVNTNLTVDQNQPANADPSYWGTDSWNGVLRDYTTNTVVRSYTDFLPSANAVFDVAEGSKVRFSAARVVARQPLVSLGEGFSTTFTRDPADDLFKFTNGKRGNAELDPFRAYQFDLGFEHYFGDQGLLSAGLFWKEVDSFIVNETVTVFVNDQGGGRMGPVSQPANGSGGRVRGLELAAQYAFDFGLGFTANYTFSDTETDFSTDFDDKLPLPGVSKHSANGQVYFEHSGFAARASYSWRSKQYMGNFSFADGSVTRTMGIYQKSYGQLDGQISYQLTDNFEVFAEAINITKANSSVYLQFPELPFRYQSGSRRIYGGVKFTF